MTIQLSNKLTAVTLMLAATLTLLGCANNSSQPKYNLDTYTLGRSAVFTQRELINEQLKDPAEIDSEVRDALLYNYCDLVARNAIYIARDDLPEQCQSRSDKETFSDNKQRQCTYNYHICVRACPLRTNDCQPCIERAKKCLAP
ncbi:hypothetical protein U062_02064 [Gammaproteobacteria bacterium MOLA455]|nr:hypothetical protein U062_02064 [Gammaproteobacteria bacterium MOLA455]